MVGVLFGAVGAVVALAAFLFTRRDVARKAPFEEMKAWMDDALNLRKRVVELEQRDIDCSRRVAELERQVGVYAMRVDALERKVGGAP